VRGAPPRPPDPAADYHAVPPASHLPAPTPGVLLLHFRTPDCLADPMDQDGGARASPAHYGGAGGGIIKLACDNCESRASTAPTTPRTASSTAASAALSTPPTRSMPYHRVTLSAKPRTPAPYRTHIHPPHPAAAPAFNGFDVPSEPRDFGSGDEA
jgi:hypothetical protein